MCVCVCGGGGGGEGNKSGRKGSRMFITEIFWETQNVRNSISQLGTILKVIVVGALLILW